MRREGRVDHRRRQHGDKHSDEDSAECFVHLASRHCRRWSAFAGRFRHGVPRLAVKVCDRSQSHLVDFSNYIAERVTWKVLC